MQHKGKNNGCLRVLSDTVGKCQRQDLRTCPAPKSVICLLATLLPSHPGTLSASRSRHWGEHHGTRTAPTPPCENLGSSGADPTCSRKQSRAKCKASNALMLPRCAMRVRAPLFLMLL